MQPLAIILLSILAAISYGIIHDQITARICIEYFTIGHPRLIDSDSPTILGLFWGIVATWWVGLPLGCGLALAASVGSRPKLTATQLIRPLLTLLACMFVIATIAGLIGFLTARASIFHLVEPLASEVPASQSTHRLSHCGLGPLRLLSIRLHRQHRPLDQNMAPTRL